MAQRRPVTDWAIDFDHLSRITMVTDAHPDDVKLSLGPLTLDPPQHAPLRRALLPAFSPHRVAELEVVVRQIVATLLDEIGEREEVDAAIEFAEQVPVRLMSHLFGVDRSQGAAFKGWVDTILKHGLLDIELARAANREILAFFSERLRSRRDSGEVRDDLISTVLDARINEDDGSVRPLTDREQIGTLYVLMLGGVDTTWSLIGAALIHLGTHPDDLARLSADPSLVPGAIEEFLRVYSPATVARIITRDAAIGGCPVDGGKRLLLSYPSANRDPAVFDRPDEVIIDREHNRHVAFGVGVHRCIGSNLARMEMEIALRGPHHVPLRIPREER